MTTTMWLPIFDGHNDVILDLYRPRPGTERSFFESSPHGHLDLPRARKVRIRWWILCHLCSTATYR